MHFYLKHTIFILISICLLTNDSKARTIRVGFLSDTLQMEVQDDMNVSFDDSLSDGCISYFYDQINLADWQSLVKQLQSFKTLYQLNDWLYYQLIRKTAQQLSPKADNYHRYTLYKWFLLCKSGYDATLSYSTNYLLFYVRSEDNIYGIPYFERDQHQYICLNYHDYGKIDFSKETVIETTVRIKEGCQPFSYKITQMPDFKPADYAVKNLRFDYQDNAYHFKVKLNPEVKALFANYPVADFGTYFNIPLSKETYGSLIPELKKNIGNMSQKQGVDFLMRFTRYSFLFENDQMNFGQEKRLSPEQTLLYEHSDCDDRAALFFYLVKEIYDLPMIVLLYPTHVTIAVEFAKPVGKPIVYKGKSYSICDPTPQIRDNDIGYIDKHLKHSNFEVVYEYNPVRK